MIGDTSEHVTEIGFRIKTVELSGFDEAVEGCGALGAPIRAGEQVVLASDRDASQGPLCRVVVEGDPAVVEDAGQRRPAGQQ